MFPGRREESGGRWGRFEILVFQGPHGLLPGGGLVVVSEEVKQAVYDVPVGLFRKRGVEFLVALGGRVEVDVNLSLHDLIVVVWGVAEGKGKDIRVVVVVEVRHVQGADGLVVCEHDAKVHQVAVLGLYDVANETFEGLLVQLTRGMHLLNG